MTPNDIEILLHYYVTPGPHPRRDAPAVQEAIQDFIRRNILVINPDNGQCKLTEKGEKLINMLCDTPDPVNRWVDPRGEERGNHAN